MKTKKTYRPFDLFSKEENEAYKNRLANGNNEWIGSRSTSALNGRVTPLSTAGKRCLMMQYVYSLMYGRHVDEFASLFDQSLKGKVKRSLREEKKRGARKDMLWWCSTTFFPDIFFFFLLFLLRPPALLLLFFASTLSSFLSCLCTRTSNSSNNYLALVRVVLHCKRILSRKPMSSSMTTEIGGGSEPWVFVYPHVVTSALPPRYSSQCPTRRGKYEERRSRKEISSYSRRALYVCVSADVRRGHSHCSHIGEFKTITTTIVLFPLLLSVDFLIDSHSTVFVSR